MKVGKFTRGLYGVQSDINLKELRYYSDIMYDIIKTHFKSDKTDYNGQSTLTTKLFTKYNLLMYPFPIFHELYCEICNAFYLCHADLFKKKPEKHYMQCWLNYYRKGEFIDWHGHQKSELQAWHGFLCVDTEPGSSTSYKWKENLDKIIEIPSKDGLIVIGPSNGDLHRSSEWEFEDRPRITIAFDIMPATSLSEKMVVDSPEPKYLNAMRDNPFYTNHWIPV